jgi:hypothetical protein
MHRRAKFGLVDVGVVERALAAVLQQLVKLGRWPGIWVCGTLEERRDLE